MSKSENGICCHSDHSVIIPVVDPITRERGIHKSLLNPNASYSIIVREVIVLQMMAHHRIPRVLSSDVIVDGRMGFVMEPVDGVNLSSRPKLDKNESLLRSVTLQILLLLEHVHSKNWLHCDIKPDNLMITRDDQVYLIDFGLAEEISNNVLYGGHPRYRPEGIAQAKPSFDLYSLACTILYLLVEKGTTEPDVPTEMARLPGGFRKWRVWLCPLILNPSHPALKSVAAFRQHFLSSIE